MNNFISVFSIAVGLVLLSVAPVLAYSGEVYTVCKLDPKGENYLSLRSCASSDCTEKLRLRPGKFVWSEEPFSERGWRAVIVMRDINDEYPVDRPRGYVFDKFICRVDMRE